MAADTAHSASITDHRFVPPPGKDWERCVYSYGDHLCGLSEAAHAKSSVPDNESPGRAGVKRELAPEEMCMVPLDDDDEIGGDGRIYCAMPKAQEHTHVQPDLPTISEKTLNERARAEAALRSHQRWVDQGKPERPTPLPVAEVDMSEAQEHMIGAQTQPMSESGHVHSPSCTWVLGTDLHGVKNPEFERLLCDCGAIARDALIDGERQEQHGDPIPNMMRIAALWSAYLGFEVTAHDAAEMMVLFKVARAKANPLLRDNYDDADGYTEIAARIVDLDRR